MSDFNPGDRVTYENSGWVRVFTVERVRGGMVCDSHFEARADLVRPWLPGDDEKDRRCADQDLCEQFEQWADLSADDAAAIAGIVRKYLPKLDDEEPI